MNDQRSVTTQLKDLIKIAIKVGLYDAADYLKIRLAADDEHRKAYPIFEETGKRKKKVKSTKEVVKVEKRVNDIYIVTLRPFGHTDIYKAYMTKENYKVFRLERKLLNAGASESLIEEYTSAVVEERRVDSDEN